MYDHVIHGTPLELQWKLTDWTKESRYIINKHLLDVDILRIYQIYHDCGKPFCRVVDEKGQHFPNHSQVSKERWLSCSDGSEIALQIAGLIGMDMDIHTLRGDDIEEFANRKEAISLLITGLCEIHSNAEMFGGIESVGFKIKWKHLNKMGSRIMKFY